jgi:hypothetical protein
MDAPLWAFQEIMEWAHDAYQNGYKFVPNEIQYASQLRKIQKFMNMSHIYPTQIPVELPGDHEGLQTIDVTTFNSFLVV